MSNRRIIGFLASGGSAGDVRPLIRLATGLKERGYEVRFLANPSFAPMAAASGISADEWTDSTSYALDETMSSRSARRWQWGQPPRVSDFALLYRATRARYAAIDRFFERLAAEPDARLVATVASVSSWKSLERAGPGSAKIISCPMPVQPSRAVSLAPREAFYRSRTGRWLFDRGARQLRGWTRRKHAEFMQRTYHLVSVSPILFPRPDDWSPNMQVTGYMPLDYPDRRQPPASLARFIAAGEPPVYFGCGSYAFLAGDRGAALAAEVTAAFSRVGVRAILQSPHLNGVDHGPGIHLLREEVSHRWLLDRCVSAVHHGGYGTTHACLKAGKPMAILPFHMDQFLWAERVAELGLGPRSTVRMRDLDREALSGQVAATLEPETRRRARAFRERLDGEDGLSVQLRAVESIIAHHRKGAAPLDWSMPTG